MNQIRPPELAAWLSDAARKPPLLLDVREPWEVALCALPGVLHMPMHVVPARLAELSPDQEIVVICHHGGRSMQVAMFLERQGYSAIHNLAGGVDAWACEVDAGMSRY